MLIISQKCGIIFLEKNMAFCKFSSANTENFSTNIDNKFISEYLPLAPEMCVKAYLYGLYYCSNQSVENSLESFAKNLNISQDDVENCFLYWQDQGLVTVLKTNPIEIRFLPVKSKNLDIKKYSKGKFADFNKQIQEIIDGRMITPTEYAEYYNLIEHFKLDPSALVMIAKYCADFKGTTVGYSYILTVAKNWLQEGVKTPSDVEQKLKEYEAIVSVVSDVLKILGSKKQAGFEDKKQYTRWIKNLGFDHETILHVAKSLNKKGGMERLNAKLEKYYELKLLSTKEIDQYEQEKQTLIEQAKMVTRQIGVYYENLENVIETYIIKWQNMGYNFDSLKLVADFCFKNNIKTLDGMNSTLEKFYSLGLISVQSIDEYFDGILETDKNIKEILTLVGLNRSVTTWDRDFYRTWTYTWNFADDVIKYACSLAVGKSHPMPYINKILSDWFKNKIDTLEKAKAQKVGDLTNITNTPKMATQRSYSSEEINALFDNLNEVKWK